MNPTRPPIWAVVLVAAALLGAGCSDDDDDGSAATVTAPPVGQPSAKYGVPLPDGAAAQPDDSRPEAEVYRLTEGTSGAEANAFFAGQTDGKPLQGFEWCGRVLDARIWHRAGADPGKEDTLEVIVDDESSEGVVVRITQRTGPPLTCPPEPPEGTS